MRRIPPFLTSLTRRLRERPRRRELEQQLERLATAVDVSKMGVFEVDTATHRLRWSKYHELLFGYAEGTFDGSREAFRSRLHPEDRDGMIAVLDRARADREPYELEGRVVWPDGSIHWIYARGQFFCDDRGVTTRGIGTVIEITERKLMEEELRRTRIAAEAASAAKSAFLASMSHEIRTPLSAVIGLSEVLQLSHPQQPAVLDLAEKINQNGCHLLALIDGILDISKIEAGAMCCDVEALDLFELLHSIHAMLLEKALAKGVELELEIASDVPRTIHSDQLRLKQILMNVVGNALKFTARGTVSIKAAMPAGQLQFTIQDTGVGVPPGSFERIFEVFAQADTSVSREFGGTGLGLYISRKLARALGGELSLVSSALGAGTMFRLTIDPHAELAGAAVAMPRPAVESPTSLPAGTRILVVEDSQDLRELIEHLLTEAGATVETAVDGAEGVLKASSRDFDAVLMDLHMPKLDGYEATRRLRSTGFSRPILALSAHAFKDEAERSLTAGCNAHITKPVNRRLLFQTLNAALTLRA